ncbi:MAG: helix-turn-helix domain-containing protein [Curvibacter sp.]|nr:MAG: helix-turn-helix domain-containing protein [Curvibacter sp.]
MTTGSTNPSTGKKESFAKLYQSVIKDKRITDKDFRILAFIKSYSSKWRAYQTHIARELETSPSTVMRSMNRLDAAGYLTSDIRLKKVGQERRNVRMHHLPSHWNAVIPGSKPQKPNAKNTPKKTAPSSKNASSGPSKVNGSPVKNDVASQSKMTGNEEERNTYKEELTTKSQVFETNGALSQDVIRSLWESYNAVPEEYIQIDPDTLEESDLNLVIRMYEESQDILAGLQLKPGQRTEFEYDAFCYRDTVLANLENRRLQMIGSHRFFVEYFGGDYFKLYVSPEFWSELR